MNEKIIDLRAKSKRPEATPEIPSRTIFSWNALEYEERSRSQRWFLTLGGISTLLVVTGILFRSYFFVAFVALAFTTILLYAKRTPRTISFGLTEQGIFTGRKFHPFNFFKSFCVFQRPGLPHELSLETENFFLPFIALPLGKTDSDRLKEILKRFLPEKEHKPSLLDQVMRNWGF